MINNKNKSINLNHSLEFPKIISRKTIYKSKYLNLYSDIVQMPSGKIIPNYHILKFKNDSVVVLLLNSKSQVCFIKSLRYPTQKVEWELPAGGIDLNETILEAAKREVKEETGILISSIKCVYSFHPSNGISNQLVHLVIARTKDISSIKCFNTDEVKEIVWLSKRQIKNLLKDNFIKDGISLIPLLLTLNKFISNDLISPKS